MLDVMFESPSSDEFLNVEVDREVVEGTKAAPMVPKQKKDAA